MNFTPVLSLVFVSTLFISTGAYSQMVQVPSASYSMGGSGGSGDADELPVRVVDIPAFSLDSKEVTAAQYDSCVAAGRCSPAHYVDGKCVMWTTRGFKNVTVPARARGKDLPVVCVSWDQARAYCGYKGKRLPYEAEWEYAASCGDARTYSWGTQQPSSARCAQAKDGGPRRVGSTSPNERYLYDMTGNVWEWTADFYQQNYYAQATRERARGPDVGYYRVVRGGGWYSGAAQLRVKNRYWFASTFGEVSIGFRCAK